LNAAMDSSLECLVIARWLQSRKHERRAGGNDVVGDITG